MARPRKSLLDRMKESFPGMDLENPLPVLKKERHPDSHVIEAESALLYYNLKGAGFTKQICPHCHEEFAYKYATIHLVKNGQPCDKKCPNHRKKFADNYTVVQTSLHCSDECRKAELAKIGIDWEPFKPPEERWGFRSFGELPAIVQPKVLRHLDSVLASEEVPH